ncbi:MAG: PQQ-binding-like beta-propeller repeat protein [Nitrospinae bacterium]|nr:PQQ-binding-like beta-propeller repeat protein [Nitrospinota bacterium]
MAANSVKFLKLWEHTHCRPVDSVSLAGDSGDVVISDNRDRLALINPNGGVVWDHKLDFAPLESRITADGSMIYVLTTQGKLMKITRDAELEWEHFVDRDGKTLAVKAGGQSAVVASHKGRFHVMSAGGERARIVHTQEPVAFARFAPRSGGFFVAGALGWIGYYNSKFDPVSELSLGRTIFDLKVSSRGAGVYLALKEEGFCFVDMAESQLTTVNPGFQVVRIGVDESGALIAAAGFDGELTALNRQGEYLWSAKSARPVVFVEMALDGSRIVTVTDKGVVSCYGAGHGVAVAEPEKPEPKPELKKEPRPAPTPKEKKPGENDFDYLEL